MSKVLIIEDDRSLADVLAYNLRQAGYEVSMAYDGMDGLSQAQLKIPDLIVLDLMLPVMDGLEVCRRLRSDPHTSDILVLMLTAKVEESDQLVGFSVGAENQSRSPFGPRRPVTAPRPPRAVRPSRETTPAREPAPATR